jgi:hypothetical protein
MPSLVSVPSFSTDFFPKLQPDNNERVNLLRFANLTATFSNCARLESERFASRLGYGALACLALDPPT